MIDNSLRGNTLERQNTFSYNIGVVEGGWSHSKPDHGTEKKRSVKRKHLHESLYIDGLLRKQRKIEQAEIREAQV